MMKKIISVVLVLAMVLSLAACSKDADVTGRGQNDVTAGVTGKDDSSNPIELVVYSQLANYSGEQTGWSAKLLLDKFNVKITIIPNSDGVFDTRMESGFLGDIVVMGNTGNDYKRAVKGGMFLDWGIHAMDQLLYLVQEPVKTVTAIVDQPLIPAGLTVRGFIIDSATGELTEVAV